MKVTVTFEGTSVVVPCKDGWTVRDLIDQAARRYRRILEQVKLKLFKLTLLLLFLRDTVIPPCVRKCAHLMLFHSSHISHFVGAARRNTSEVRVT